jgi:hypothetical protein
MLTNHAGQAGQAGKLINFEWMGSGKELGSLTIWPNMPGMPDQIVHFLLETSDVVDPVLFAGHTPNHLWLDDLAAWPSLVVVTSGRLSGWVEQYRLGCVDHNCCLLECLVQNHWKLASTKKLASKLMANAIHQASFSAVIADDFIGKVSVSIITSMGSLHNLEWLRRAGQHERHAACQMFVDTASVLAKALVCKLGDQLAMMTSLGRMVGHLPVFGNYNYDNHDNYDNYDNHDNHDNYDNHDNHDNHVVLAKMVDLVCRFSRTRTTVWVVHRLVKVLVSSPHLAFRWINCTEWSGKCKQVVDMLRTLCCKFGRKCYPALARHAKQEVFVHLVNRDHSQLVKDMVMFGGYNCPDEMARLVKPLFNPIGCNHPWRVMHQLRQRWPEKFDQQFDPKHPTYSSIPARVARDMRVHLCDDMRRFLMRLPASALTNASWSDVGWAIFDQVKMVKLVSDRQVGTFQHLLQKSVVIRQIFVDAGGLGVLSKCLARAAWWHCSGLKHDTIGTNGTNDLELWNCWRNWTRLCWLVSSAKPTVHDKHGRLAIRTMRRLFIKSN